MHMGRVFQRTVERYPNRTAVVDQDEGVEYSYKEWNERVNRLATSFEKMGLGPGDRIGVVMQPRVQAGTIYWAAQKCGMTFVPYSIRVATDELQFLVDNTEVDFIIYSSVARDAVDGAQAAFTETAELIYVDPDVPSYARSFEDVLATDPDPVEPADVDSDETSLILHTSGTTGRPKGVPRSHTNTYTAANAHAIQAQWVDNETTLGLMPIYHTMGIRTLVTMGLVSGTWVAQRSFSPEQTLAIIESENVTSAYLVPTVFYDLVKSSAITEADVSSVDRLAYAGTPMSETVQKRIREIFSPEVFINHYGSTEIYTYSVCSWIDSKPESAGRAGINTRVRVVTAERGEPVSPSETVDSGTRGEIIVDATSPEAFKEYLNRPEATEKAFEDGWYFTGDLGYRDEDGDLFVVGRVDDMIISGGENIYPAEVENVLNGYKAINEAVIVGLDDERWNQVVTAFVTVPEDPASLEPSKLAEQLDEYCRESADLANYKRPRKYVFVDEIPISNVGKVLRRKLDTSDLDTEVYGDIEI